ncbi:MAG TPA: BON domain-containing protein [Gemmatimonadaceae bacterium]|nr:BON domain-containing protein [Gemmatimonadaceae bacterium]
MAHDFENIDDIDDLSDAELRRLVRERLADHRGLDPRDITVHVRDRVIELSGRVGTEGERRIAERVITDTIGLPNVQNDLIVDVLRRAESPEAADDSEADEEDHADLQLGGGPLTTSPEAAHLEEDLDGRLFGTSDVGSAIQNGTAWIPPTGPTQEGIEQDNISPDRFDEFDDEEE